MGNATFSKVYWRSKRLDSVSAWLAGAREVHSPKAAKAFLGMSLAEMGRGVARIEGRAEPYRKATVANWTVAANRKRFRPMNDSQIKAVGVLIANRVVQLSGRENIGIHLTHNSPWRITVWARCLCGKWYELKRADWRGCKRHRA